MNIQYGKINECTILQQGIFSFGRIFEGSALSDAVKAQLESLERKFELESLAKPEQ